MNKSAILAAMLILASSSAYAYENSYAGYSVKDGQPYYKLEAKKVYAYTNISSKKAYQNEEDLKNTAVNIVNYYTAEDMEQILGEKFSTAYLMPSMRSWRFRTLAAQPANRACAAAGA